MQHPKNQVPKGMPAQPHGKGTSGETKAYTRVPNANEHIGDVNYDFQDGNRHLQKSLGRASAPTWDMQGAAGKVPTNNSNPVHKQEDAGAVSLD